MVLLTIPKILFNAWFWIGLIAIIAAIHFFWGKTPPPPKPSKFFTKHKKTIHKVMDVCIICFVLVYCLLLMSFPVRQIFGALHAPQPIRAIDLHFALAFFLMNLIIISGFSGFFIGLLSVFLSNLTKVKRIILLIVSLFPLIFTTLLLLITPMIMPTEESEQFRISIIKLGIGSMVGCWLINGPAIIIGKHFFRVSWAILRALRLVSGEYPG